MKFEVHTPEGKGFWKITDDDRTKMTSVEWIPATPLKIDQIRDSNQPCSHADCRCCNFWDGRGTVFERLVDLGVTPETVRQNMEMIIAQRGGKA